MSIASRFAIPALFVAALAGPAAASTIGLTTRTGGDTVNWGNIGPCRTGVPSGATVTSTNGVTTTVTMADGPGQIRTQSTCEWNGNFAPGDSVLWTNFNDTDGRGPITLSFLTAVNSVGAQIELDSFQSFTAEIQAFHGSTPLGTFTEAGNSTTNADNSAIFIGIADSSNDITSVVFSITPDCGDGFCEDFAINQLSLSETLPDNSDNPLPGDNGNLDPPGAPEPGSLTLAGAGVAALLQRVRRARAATKPETVTAH